jgi:hypothetical protein
MAKIAYPTTRVSFNKWGYTSLSPSLRSILFLNSSKPQMKITTTWVLQIPRYTTFNCTGLIENKGIPNNSSKYLSSYYTDHYPNPNPKTE